MDVDGLIQYYVERLIYQYRSKPKARATIAIFVKQLIAEGLLRNIEDGFWLDRAIGEQLDTLGKYVGLPRNIGPSSDEDFFGFHDYVVGQPDNPNGFRDYTDPSVNSNGVWYSYLTKKKLKTEIPDSAYVPMIRLKALVNVWDGTLAGAQDILRQFLFFSDQWARLEDKGNELYNPLFLYGVDGWSVTDEDTTLPVTLGMTTSPWALTGGATLKASVVGTPAAGTGWHLDADRVVAVIPGRVVAFSAYVQALGATQIAAAVVFQNALGVDLPVTGEAVGVATTPTQGLLLSDYDELTGTVSVPDGAVSCSLRVRAVADGTTASPWVATCRVDLREDRLVPAPYGVVVNTANTPSNRCHPQPARTGTTGWHQTDNGTGLPVVLSAQTAPNGLLNYGTARATVTGTPADGAQWTITTYPDRFAVTPGQRIDVSAYVQGVGIKRAIVSVAYALSGTVSGAYPVTTMVMDTATDFETLAGYRKGGGFGVVPSGVNEAYLQVNAIADGTANPWVGVAKPMIQVAAEGQTENAPWTPGLEVVGIAEAAWYTIEADLGLDPTTIIPYLPRKVGTSIRLTYSKPGLAATDYTLP